MLRPLLIALAAAAAMIACGPATAEEPKAMLLSERLAEGAPFVVIVKQGSLPLRAGDWSYPRGHDYWTVFEGRFDPESGIWQSDAVGFQVRGIEYHSCPPDLDHSRFYCGGVHTSGHRLRARVTPRDHVLVILENELTFDEAGNVYLAGAQIGVVTIPPRPY